MQVKSYFGESLSRVMTQIKRELGDEAVILGTNGPDRDGKGYEVMAAVEHFGSEDGGSGKGASSSSDLHWEEMRREWERLRDSMLAVLQPRMELGRLAPRQKLAVQYLEKEGVDTEFVLHLWSRLKDRPQASVLGAMREMLDFKPWKRHNWPQQIHVFVGPHGAGKTSTILRQALYLRRQEPDFPLALVNTDNGHGRTRSYLRHYAELSGLEYRETETSRDLGQVLQELGSHRMILVDTPGLEAGRTMEERLQSPGWRNMHDACFHLVLNPLFSARQYEAILHRYRCPQMASCVWCKLDEACAFGDMLNVGWRSGLPFSLFSSGSALKETLVPAEEKDFWQLVFKHTMPLSARKSVQV